MSITTFAKAFDDGYFEENPTISDRYDYHGDDSQDIFIERDVVFEERFNVFVDGKHSAILEPHPIIDRLYEVRKLDR